MTTGFKCPRMGYGIPPFMTIKQWNSGLPHFRILLICLPIMMGISCYFMKQTWGRVTIIGVCHGLWRLWTLKPAFRTRNLGSLHRSFLKWFIPSLPEPSRGSGLGGRIVSDGGWGNQSGRLSNQLLGWFFLRMSSTEKTDTISWKILKSNIPNPLDSGDQFPPDKSLAKP